jgi:hypothetical protein
MSAPLDGPTEDYTAVNPTGPKTIESKLVVSTTVATLLYAVLSVVADNTAVLDFLPPWAKSVVVVLLPPALAFFAGYRVPSNRV